MKSIIRTFTAILATAATAVPLGAFAHGGAVDRDGCHQQKRIDDLHCHGAAGVSGTKPIIQGVASVIDGDTIDIHGKRIRLHGIDAPESAQTCLDAAGKAYRCGQKAALALADQIGRRTVTCETKDIDRYGRVVGACAVGGQSINAWMVNQGWAVAYRQYSQDYVGDETQARERKRGIWRGDFKMPWDWRKARKNGR